MINLIAKRASTMKTLAIWIGIPVLIFMGINNSADMRRNTRDTNRIISRQAAQDKQRDTNLKKLIANNDQQTKILCVLIIRNSNNFTAEERANIQAICQKQINEASGVKSDTAFQTGSSVPSTQTTVNQAPSPQSTPTPKSSQSDTPQPAQPSTIKKIQNTLTGVVDKLNPLN